MNLEVGAVMGYFDPVRQLLIKNDFVGACRVNYSESTAVLKRVAPIVVFFKPVHRHTPPLPESERELEMNGRQCEILISGQANDFFKELIPDGLFQSGLYTSHSI